MKQLDGARLARAAEGMNKALARRADAEAGMQMAEDELKWAAQAVADAQAEFEMAKEPVEKPEKNFGGSAAAPAAGVITEKSRA